MADHPVSLTLCVFSHMHNNSLLGLVAQRWRNPGVCSLNTALLSPHTPSSWFHLAHGFVYHWLQVFLIYISSLVLSSALLASNSLLNIFTCMSKSYLKFNSSENELTPHDHHNSKPTPPSFKNMTTQLIKPKPQNHSWCLYFSYTPYSCYQPIL